MSTHSKTATNSDEAIAPVQDADLLEIAALHARAFGPGRFSRSAYRVREGTPAFTQHCRVMREGGRLIAAVRFTDVAVGNQTTALLLGPVAVEPGLERQGVGTRLLSAVISDLTSSQANHGKSWVILVGDEAYYARHGFEQVPPGQITFPGPVDPARILIRAIDPAKASPLPNGRISAPSD